MNVLVYAGQGATTESVRHSVETLTRFLSPHYAVTTVSDRTLKQEPWETKTAAIVFPGGADLPYVRDLKGDPTKKINNFVKKGGVYIGFCAGGYFGASRCEFAVGTDIEVSGPRELGFFSGTAKGPAFSGFRYHSEDGARATALQIKTEAFSEVLPRQILNYFNGGAVFADAKESDAVEILARYADDDLDIKESSRAAILLITHGKGRVLLSGTHPEFLPDFLKKTDPLYNSRIVKQLEEDNVHRQLLVKNMLIKCGLKVNEHPWLRPRLTPWLLSSINTKPVVSQFVHNLGNSDDFIFDGNQDVFRLRDASKNPVSVEPEKVVDEDPELAVKKIYYYENGIPEPELTPEFNVAQYYETLKREWNGRQGEIGSTVMYGEIVTSTSQILDKNASLTEKFRGSSLIAVGTVQVMGKGRGGNVWVNPRGVMASTARICLPMGSNIVFVQYLAMLAMCQAIVEYGPGYEDIPVKIKWPNDLYAFNGTEWVKISGLLVNTSILNGEFSLLVGCGVNVANSSGPTTSLNNLVDALNVTRQARGEAPLDFYKQEILLAKYANKFDLIMKQFVTQGVRSVLPDYYKHWMHSNQIVQLVDYNNVRCKITGITEDYGLLTAQEIDSQDRPSGNCFQLQPDGNSFDIFHGLISKKTT